MCVVVYMGNVCVVSAVCVDNGYFADSGGEGAAELSLGQELSHPAQQTSACSVSIDT